MANAIHSPHFLLMLKQCPSSCSSSRTSWMFCIFIISVPSRLQDLRLFSKCSDLTIVHRGPFCCLWEQFCSIRQVLIVKSKNMWVVYFHLLLKSFCDFVGNVFLCTSLFHSVVWHIFRLVLAVWKWGVSPGIDWLGWSAEWEGRERGDWTNTFCKVDKYILQCGQIHFQGGQIHFARWTNTLCNVDKYMFKVDKNIFQGGQIHFCKVDKYTWQFKQICLAIWTNLFYLVWLIRRVGEGREWPIGERIGPTIWFLFVCSSNF